jgi:hypothetical protein
MRSRLLNADERHMLETQQVMAIRARPAGSGSVSIATTLLL